MAEEKKEKDWSVVFALLVVGVPVVIFFALDLTVLPYWKSGEVEEARMIPTPDGDRLFVLESVSDGEDGSLDRLKVYDPSDLRKKPVQTWTRKGVSFRGYAGGRLWFESNDDELGWHARDPRTLEVTVTEPLLAKADSRLARVHAGSFTGDALLLSTLDGYELRVDAETLSISDAPKDARMRGSSSTPSIDLSETAYGENEKLAFEGNPRRQLVKLRRKVEYGEPNPDIVLGTESFLDPRFLRPRRDDARAYLVPDPESVLVTHHKTVEYSSPLSISRIATDGRVLWTRGLGEEHAVEEVALFGDFLIVVTRDHIRSLYLKDGSVAALVNN